MSRFFILGRGDEIKILKNPHFEGDIIPYIIVGDAVRLQYPEGPGLSVNVIEVNESHICRVSIVDDNMMLDVELESFFVNSPNIRPKNLVLFNGKLTAINVKEGQVT